jgi:Flp pilus assembly protein TadG
MVVVVRPRSARRRAHGNPAQALVEFALIGPVLALLFLGATDLTRAFYYYVVLANASREAARVIIDYPQQYTDSAACTAGHNEAVPFLNLSCTGTPVTIIISPAACTTCTPPTRLPGQNTVTVTTKTTFTPTTPLIEFLMGNPITIQAQTTFVTWY